MLKKLHQDANHDRSLPELTIFNVEEQSVSPEEIQAIKNISGLGRNEPFQFTNQQMSQPRQRLSENNFSLDFAKQSLEEKLFESFKKRLRGISDADARQLAEAVNEDLETS